MKKERRILAAILVMVLCVTALLPRTGIYLAAKSKIAKVKTQQELDKALKDKLVKNIMIKSGSGKLKIKKGNYSGVKLTVNSAKARIVNSGTFKQIQIKNAQSFTENGKDNNIKSTAGKLKMNVKKAAKNLSLNIAKKNANTTVTVAGSVSNISISKPGSKTTIKLTGSLNAANVNAASELIITGEAKQAVAVAVNADGAKFTTSVQAEVAVAAKADIAFEKGAEDSKVVSTVDGEKVNLRNNTEKDITVSGKEGDTVIKAGEEATVKKAADNNVAEDKKQMVNTVTGNSVSSNTSDGSTGGGGGGGSSSGGGGGSSSGGGGGYSGGSSGGTSSGGGGGTSSGSSGSSSSDLNVTTLIAAKQISHDEIELTFSKKVDASSVTYESVSINGTSGVSTAVNVAEDGFTATIVYAYVENTTYNFSVRGISGTATVKTGSYAVTDIVFESQEVEACSEQDIRYSLVAGDVDVTRYGNYLSYVTLDFDGDFAYCFADPVKPTIYFSEKDQTANVTIKYDNGVANVISKTAKITSIAPTATKAEPRFATKLLKWYLVDDTQDTFDMSPDDTGTRQIVFYAKDEGGRAVQYDEVDVISLNENIATVTCSKKANGKYYIIEVEPGGRIGTTEIRITAHEHKNAYDCVAEYSFSIVSKEFDNNLYDVQQDVTEVSIFNSPGASEAEVEINPVNVLGQTVTCDYDIEVFLESDDASSLLSVKFEQNYKQGIKINALGAPAGTYIVSVWIAGEYGANLKEINRKITVNVSDALSKVCAGGWNISDGNIIPKSGYKNDVSATYETELAEWLGITDYKGKHISTEVKLMAYVDGMPVGYISENGVDGYVNGETLSTRLLKNTLGYENIDYDLLRVYVYSGNNYYNNTYENTMYLGQLRGDEYTRKELAVNDNAIKPGGSISVFSQTDGMINEVYYYGKENKKNNIAADGIYNAVVMYGNDFDSGIQMGDIKKFNVDVDLTMPTVEYNASESADQYVISDVDLVRADDGYSVSYCAGTSSIRYPDYVFGTEELSKGMKIYAVRIDDVRGGWSWDAAENVSYYAEVLSGNSGCSEVELYSGKYSFDGGIFEGGILIHFVIERTVMITA